MAKDIDDIDYERVFEDDSGTDEKIEFIQNSQDLSKLDELKKPIGF